MKVLQDVREEAMWVCAGGVVYRISCSDIVFMEALDRQVIIHTLRGDIAVPYMRLGECAERGGKMFWQCHRSIVVNPYYIEKICVRERKIYLREGMGEIAVGRKYMGEIKNI